MRSIQYKKTLDISYDNGAYADPKRHTHVYIRAFIITDAGYNSFCVS